MVHVCALIYLEPFYGGWGQVIKAVRDMLINLFVIILKRHIIMNSEVLLRADGLIFIPLLYCCATHYFLFFKGQGRLVKQY